VSTHHFNPFNIIMSNTTNRRTYVGSENHKLNMRCGVDPLGTAPAPTAQQATATKPAPWPPKLQPVKSVASPAAMLEQPGQAEQDLRAEAAEIVRVHRLTTGRMPLVKSWKEWERVGAVRAAKDGCTLVMGIKREGYLHPYVSQTDPGKRGTPGAKPSIQLTKAQMAERAAAWSQFKGCSVIDAFKYLGLQF
jgi:hypothetical protein